MKATTKTTSIKLIPGELYKFKNEVALMRSSPFICACEHVGPQGSEGYFAIHDGLVDSKSIMLLLEITEHDCQWATDNNSKVVKLLCKERTLFFLEKQTYKYPSEELAYCFEDLIGICTHD